MPLLYTMDPIVCNSCGAQFEPNMISRIGLWLFVTGLTVPVFTLPYLAEQYRPAALILAIAIPGLVVLAAIIGSVVESFHPWQFKPWDSRHLRRAVVNYGALGSFVLYGILLFKYKIG